MRCSDAGYVDDVHNRAVGRANLFCKPADYVAFEKVLRDAWERQAMRLLAYVIMPTTGTWWCGRSRTERLASVPDG